MTSKIIAILLLISAVSATGNPRLFDASWRAAITPEATFVRPTPRTGETHGINQGIKLYTHMPNKHYAFVDYAPLGTNSLIGWWRGEDNATDDSSYGHDGTWGGTAAYADGRFGRAFDFDGASYVASTNVVLSDFTASFWYRTPDNTAERYLLGLGYSNNDSALVYYNSSGIIILMRNGSNNRFNTIGPRPSNNVLYHVSVTRTGQVLRGYTNGVLSVADDNPAIDFEIDQPVEIGWSSPRANAAAYFNGEIDDVMIFNRALSASEISALYNAQANQYTNSITLPVGTNSATGYAVNEEAVKATTETRTWTTE
jgi:hypothetical protein